MTYLFRGRPLTELLGSQVKMVTEWIENLPDDEVLSRSVDDMIEQFTLIGSLAPLTIGDDPVDGSVSETLVSSGPDWRDFVDGVSVTASYEYRGETRLLHHNPTGRPRNKIAGDSSAHLITVKITRAGIQQDPEQVRQAIDDAMEPIRQMADYVNDHVVEHNTAAHERVRQLLTQRRDRIQKRHALAGALGFPLSRRNDPPEQVPLRRKAIGTARRAPQERGPYTDEPALTDAQYEDALAVVRSTLLAMERTPSVASGKAEEDLRDQILVQLNGTFEGAATGETFVQKGKTDILVAVDERHVFVGECKWWSGPKAFSDAVDQLIGYLPWRNEKAALILFIDRRDASSVIKKTDETIRAHSAFKRVGKQTEDPTVQRNFVLGHPDDPEREIHAAVMFAVLPKTISSL